MPITSLQDVIVPEVFNPYVINRTAELSAIVQSGIVVRNPEFDRLASQAAPTVNMPFFEDLTGDSEQIIEGADLIAAKITSNKDVAAIFRRAKMWGATDLSAAMAGADPMAAIGNLVAGFWARDMQRELLAILKGVFSSTSMEGNVHDISAASGAASYFTGSTFVDAAQKLGDNQQILTAVLMHSATHASLKKQELIQTVRPSENINFEVFQGKRVIIDDSCPVAEGVYTSFLFGSGAIAHGVGNPVGFVATETDRDKKKGSGVDYLINRQTSIMHPRGIKFTNTNVALTEGPSRTEFQDPTNWERVYEHKQIRIVEFKHKLKP